MVPPFSIPVFTEETWGFLRCRCNLYRMQQWIWKKYAKNKKIWSIESWFRCLLYFRYCVRVVFGWRLRGRRGKGAENLTQILPAFTWAPHQVTLSLTQIRQTFTWAPHQVLFSLSHWFFRYLHELIIRSFYLSHRFFWHLHELPIRSFLSLTQILLTFSTHELPIRSLCSLTQIIPVFKWAPHQVLFYLPRRFFRY